MKKFYLAIGLICLLGLATSVSSQVRDYSGVLNPISDFEPTKIAVEDARYIGIDYITAADTVLMNNCGVILRRDLDFSPYFEIVLFDEFFMKHLE